MRERIVDLALDAPELSPRELATRFTDKESYLVSEASVYRLLNAHDLITSPAFVVMNTKLQTVAMHLMTDTAGSAFPAPSSKLLVTLVTVVTSLLSG